jgi:hypothetical protein
VKAKSGTLLIDRQTGLADAWKTGWKPLPMRLDLELPSALAVTNRMALTLEGQPENTFATSHTFAGQALKISYATSGDGVNVRAAWAGGAPEGAALLIDLPTAERWFTTTAEGTFESPFRVRHPGCDGVVGSIYRLPQGTATLWDSRLHPFGLDAVHARVGMEVGGRRVSFGFDPARLPASVQLLDRVGDDRGLKVLVTWRDSVCGVTSGVDEVAFTIRTDKRGEEPATGTGDARLTAVGGGWAFENAHYRARVGRNGVLAGLWRKEGAAGWRPVLRRSQLYTDKGFEGDKDCSQEDDVEATSRFERCASGVRLSFCGELRGFYRFDKMSHPIRFYSAYTFDDGPAFRRTCAFNAAAPSPAAFAFLSLLTNVEAAERVAFSDAAGEFLTGERGDGKARAAQTAKAADPARLPTDLRVSGADGLALRLGDMTWFGVRPANVFLHGNDLHMAWMDGKPDNNSGAGQWNGVSLSVACGEGAAAARDDVPLARGGRTELLRDGSFEQVSGGGLVLLQTGRALPQTGQSLRMAWQLPSGAEVVSEGGNRCASVEGDGKEYRLIRQTLPTQVFPAGSIWRLTARMKGTGIEKADAGWKTACLRWSVFADGHTAYATASLPVGDSDWREVSVETTVPAGLTGVSVEAGLNGNRGRMWIDDMRLEKIER